LTSPRRETAGKNIAKSNISPTQEMFWLRTHAILYLPNSEKRKIFYAEEHMYAEAMQAVVDYIEANLKTDIIADELAAIAGYSKYHFYSVFSAVVGRPVAGYILHRRLKHALHEIAGGRTAIEVVSQYGFDTYAGFYKAFVREYGCSPKKYVEIFGNDAAKPQKWKVPAMSYSKSELRTVLGNWNIDTNAAIGEVPVMAGAKISDSVWAIGDSHYLITANGDDEISRQLKDTAIAKTLARQGFNAALPVPTKTGDETWRSPDGAMFTLTQRVPGFPVGKCVSLGEFGVYDKERLGLAYNMGAAIGKLHMALLTLDGEVAVDDADSYHQVAEWALPEVRKQNKQWEMGLSDEFFDDYLTTFGELCPQLPRQIIHRDPNPSNILLEGDNVTGFIDFELSERNIRLFDPCYCATGILSETPDLAHFDAWLHVTKQILHGYDSANPLTEAEKQSVFYVICSIQLTCIAYFSTIDDPDFRRLTETNRKMLTLIAANKERIQALI
jgi:Ser/Thr protein kinase RdoA (MazF antagonist)/AraC-like DNA-binding protein